MTLHRRFRPDPVKRKRFILILVVLVVSITLFTWFKDSVFSLTRPVWQGQGAIARGINNFLQTLRTKESLVRENQDLKEKIRAVELIEMNARTLEDTQLEMLELFGRDSKNNFVLAAVLASPPKTMNDLLIVDVGENEGILVGDLVSHPEGGALGLVQEVLKHESKVILYSSNSIKTTAYLERGEHLIELLGQGGGTFISSVPKDVEVVVGDKILLPGIQSELLAVVKEVKFETTDAVKTILAKGVANIYSLRFVEINKKR